MTNSVEELKQEEESLLEKYYSLMKTHASFSHQQTQEAEAILRQINHLRFLQRVLNGQSE